MTDSLKDIIVVGGGLAGLTSAIDLSQKGYEVLLIEKQAYPRHKVCGEYISNEVLPYLQSLSLDINSLHPSHIKNVMITNVSGKVIHGKLPLGGFGVSRYVLDDYLMQQAISSGVNITHETVDNITFDQEQFTVNTSKNDYTAKVVLGAYGKRSTLDKTLQRKTFYRKSSWLAVKAHYKGSYPNDMVALHNFKGGYCGVSKVENDIINVCYLADYKSFKKYKNIKEYESKVLSENKHLKVILKDSTPIFDQPLTISQLDFKPKSCIENHMLMIGDTAGLIYPLSGNGMAMAIQGAQLAAVEVDQFLKGNMERVQMEKQYAKQWKKTFQKRLSAGRAFSYLFRHQWAASTMQGILAYFPSLLPLMIKQTHGQPIAIHE